MKKKTWKNKVKNVSNNGNDSQEVLMKFETIKSKITTAFSQENFHVKNTVKYLKVFQGRAIIL